MGNKRRTTNKKSLNRRIVAGGMVAGKSTKAIARDANMSTRNVQRIAGECETQLLITEAFRPFHALLHKMALHSIKVVNEAMLAMKADPQDWTSRLKAVEQYGELLFLAQGKLVDPPEQEQRQMSWEEFCVMYHARNPDPSEEPVA